MSTNHTFIQSEPGLWTVGFYHPCGSWEPMSDHNIQQEARDEVIRLNGGTPTPAAPPASTCNGGHLQDVTTSHRIQVLQDLKKDFPNDFEIGVNAKEAHLATMFDVMGEEDETDEDKFDTAIQAAFILGAQWMGEQLEEKITEKIKSLKS